MESSDLLKELRIERNHREDNTNRGRWWWLIGTLAGVLTISGVCWWKFAHQTIVVKTTAALSPAAVNSGDVALQATGYVTARQQATVSAQITGTLIEVLIEEGNHVQKGQILAQLDDSAYVAALDVARAQAAAAQALVAQHQAELVQNLRDSDRYRLLATAGLVSQQTAEQAYTLAESTRAQLIFQQKTAVSDEAQVVAATVNLGYCKVRAPFDGVITTKDAQVGEIISPLSAGGGFTRTGIGTIVNMDSLEIDVDVNEAYIGRVRPGMHAEAVLDAYPDWKIPAHVIAIVPAADRGKATVKVRLAMELKDDRIVPEMGVRVSFFDANSSDQATKIPKGALVPKTSIVHHNGHDVVFVVSAGKLDMRVVQPGVRDYGELKLVPVEVQVGESVVVSPSPSLRVGENVQTENASL
jgi:RND family efflux transporter MFP subunit